MLESDNIFLEELKKGHSWQLWVAVQFLKEGFAVQVPVLRIRPDISSIDKFIDHGDVFVLVRGRMVKFECKSRSLRFSSVEDYPYETAFVAQVNTWRRKQAMGSAPLAVLLVSQVTGNIVVIPMSTEGQWRIEERFDSVRNYTRDYYLVAKDQLKSWHDLITVLKRAYEVR